MDAVSSFRNLFHFDPVARWLKRLNRQEAWFLILAVFGLITVFDLSPYGHEANLRSLYILPIVFACWTLPAAQAVGVTGLVIATLFIKAPLTASPKELEYLVASGVARTIAYLFLTVVVLSFRRLYDQASTIADRDGMTGVLNRSAFTQKAMARIAQMRLRDQAFMLCYLDLDGFKKLNDEHGHRAGDTILTVFAHQTALRMRAEDIFGRVGGDEFAALLSATSRTEAAALAQQLHNRMSQCLDELDYGVTLSMGALFVSNDDDLDYATLTHEADRLMYAAKSSGRNRVIFGSVPVKQETETCCDLVVGEPTTARL